jgi:hypothetical protein
MHGEAPCARPDHVDGRRHPRLGRRFSAIGEVGHLVENGVDLWDNILAVDNDRCPFRRPKRHVQNILSKLEVGSRRAASDYYVAARAEIAGSRGAS